MGLLVHSGVLPNGIPIKNVYISLGDFSLKIAPIYNKKGWFQLNTTYCVYADNTKKKGTDMKFEIFIEIHDPTKPLYEVTYDYIKSLYPDSENIL